MEPFRVFVSSIMRREVDDLKEERIAAEAVIRHFDPITEPWMFEVEPASSEPLVESYLNAVKQCDVFVLIMGGEATEPIINEFRTAQDHGKPILILARKQSSRSEDAAAVLRAADTKYAEYEGVADFRSKLREALGMQVLRVLRGHTSAPVGVGDTLASLRRMQRSASHIAVCPLVPDHQFNEFLVESIDGISVRLTKLSSNQEVTIPKDAVRTLPPAPSGQHPTLQLAGRLQWVSLALAWQFFPEPVDASDPLRLGFPHATTMNDPVTTELGQRGDECRWVRKAEIPRHRGNGFAVFYDGAGRYRMTANGMVLMHRAR